MIFISKALYEHSGKYLKLHYVFLCHSHDTLSNLIKESALLESFYLVILTTHLNNAFSESNRRCTLDMY